MIVQKCFQYRIYPTPQQQERFRQFAGCRRLVWNWALARRMEHYKQTGKSLSFEDQCKELTLLKQQEEYAYLQEADSQALQQVLRDLNQAFQNFFKNPKHFRFPKKKKKRSTPNAFRIPQRVSLKDAGLQNCLEPQTTGGDRSLVRQFQNLSCLPTSDRSPTFGSDMDLLQPRVQSRP